MDILLDNVNIVLILVFFLNIFLWSIIFYNGKNKKINNTYSIVVTAVINWILGMIFYRSASSDMSLFWCIFLYVPPTIIASSFLYFTYVFPKDEENLSSKRRIIFLINFFVILLTIIPGFIIKEVNIRPGLEKEIIFGSYFLIYFIYMVSFFFYGFIRLFRKYKKSLGIEKQQILYLLIGDFLSTNIAFVTNLTMPWVGYFFLNWAGQISTVIMVAFAAYAILKYRLMDVRIVARKIFIYLGVAIFVYISYFVSIWFYINQFGGIFNTATFFIGIVAAPVFTFLFFGSERYLSSFANKYFFYSLYNYQETINKLSRELSYYIDLDKIIDLIVNTVKQIMQLDRAGVLLVSDVDSSHFQVSKVIGFDEENGISLVKDNFLTQYLEETKAPLIKDEMRVLANSSGVTNRKRFLDLYDHMDHIEASICLPIIFGKKLSGIIVLGSKISGDSYTLEDIELLSTLSYQAGIAIENAKFYKQVQDLNKNLQEKVEEQTKDIKKKMSQLRVINKKLIELDKHKNDFVSIAAHQLRTPAGVIKNYASMLKQGLYGEVSEKTHEPIDRIYENGVLLASTVSSLLDISRIESGKQKIEFVKVNLSEMMKNIVGELDSLAKKKNLVLSLETKEGDYNAVFDKEKTEHMFNNLIENSIKYTDAGSVAVKLYTVNGSICVDVTDTGRGMSKTFIDTQLYQKFAREESVTKNINGNGLGMYFVKEVVNLHKGKIDVVSEVGKGTTFTVTLPKNLKEKKGEE